LTVTLPFGSVTVVSYAALFTVEVHNAVLPDMARVDTSRPVG